MRNEEIPTKYPYNLLIHLYSCARVGVEHQQTTPTRTK